MKCVDCGANLPFKAYGDVKCEYCNTPNYVPVPEEIKEAFEQQPEPIVKGLMYTLFPRTHCRFNVGRNEVTIGTGWATALVIKVNGKKIKSIRPLTGGKKEWVFGIGGANTYLKLVIYIPLGKLGVLFRTFIRWEYEVYVT